MKFVVCRVFSPDVVEVKIERDRVELLKLIKKLRRKAGLDKEERKADRDRRRSLSFFSFLWFGCGFVFPWALYMMIRTLLNAVALDGEQRSISMHL